MNDPKDYQTNSVDGAEAFERGRADEEIEEFEDDEWDVERRQLERDEQLREEYLDDKFQREREDGN